VTSRCLVNVLTPGLPIDIERGFVPSRIGTMRSPTSGLTSSWFEMSNDPSARLAQGKVLTKDDGSGISHLPHIKKPHRPDCVCWRLPPSASFVSAASAERVAAYHAAKMKAGA
jgi:hypothetical protein